MSQNNKRAPFKGNEYGGDIGDRQIQTAPPLTQSKAYGVGEDGT